MATNVGRLTLWSILALILLVVVSLIIAGRT